ncbi:carbohydrate sulfotransferase 5-like [Montipora foliosa]|uniref:carbohydrate sulfotransferase 5-like n=1 Tax=Montipora foliosa TaxID=591990 RepID=UPI0035F1F8AE
MAARRFKERCIFLITSAFIVSYLLYVSTQRNENREKKFETGTNDLKLFQIGHRGGLETPSNHEQPSKTTRRNLVIMSHGRSGSSLVGDIFNHHPSVFYMYEPLQTPMRIDKQTATDESFNISYSGLVKQFLTGVFRCKFNHPEILADIERYYRKPGHPRISQAIASPPLCPYALTDPRWDPALCYPMTSESLEDVCKNNYNLTVIKVLISRVPGNNIKTILDTCNSLEDVHCKVVFLVRDPRAVIPSSRMIGFIKDYRDDASKSSMRVYSYHQCKQLEDNLEFIRQLPFSLRSRIRLQRYEDLAKDPLKELSDLYEFAALSVPESVRIWLNETTHLSRRNCTEMDGVSATCTKDDAWAAANRWRWKVNPYDIDIIEHYCGNVMQLLGYKAVQRSFELLADVTKALFSDEFDAKYWLLSETN